MKATILERFGYSFDAEVVGNTYEVEYIDKDKNDIFLIIDHVHDNEIAYPAGTSWRFKLSDVQLIEDKVDTLVRELSEKDVGREAKSEDGVYHIRVIGIISPTKVLAESVDEIECIDSTKPFLMIGGARDMYWVTDTSKVKTKSVVKRRSKPGSKIIISYKDGSKYTLRRILSVVVDEKDKVVRVTSKTNKGSIEVKENVTIPFSVLSSFKVTRPEEQFTYTFDEHRVTSVLHKIDKNSALRKDIL